AGRPGRGAGELRRHRQGVRGAGRARRGAARHARTAQRRAARSARRIEGGRGGRARAREPARRRGRAREPMNVARTSCAWAMRALVATCIRRPVFAFVLIATLVVVGVASFLHLGVDRFPAVDVPTVSVRTTLPGASTEDVETLVSQRIEE